MNKVNPTQGPNEKKAIAYLDGFFSIANITDEERDLIGKAKRAITTGKFQQLQRDVNKLRNATKKDTDKSRRVVGAVNENNYCLSA